MAGIMTMRALIISQTKSSKRDNVERSVALSEHSTPLLILPFENYKVY